jgi:dipeptidyl-peptidase 4
VKRMGPSPRGTVYSPLLAGALFVMPGAGGLIAATSAEELTVARIFAAPDLNGSSLRAPQIAPGGRRVTFLQGKPDNKDQLDLWEYDVASGATRMLVDSRSLVPAEGQLSAEEEQRRERQRMSSLSGIVEYLFAPDGRSLLFPLGGDLYHYDLDKPAAQAVRRLTQTDAYETDAQFSPRGRYVSFVREQDLHVMDLRSGREHAVTTDGKGLVSNGMAEFIAQEEMGRNTGYWWSPDERSIAFTRIDETPVEVRERFEIGAEDVEVIRQRYPAAGTPNVLLELKIARLEGGRGLASGPPVNVDLGSDRDIYVPRVDWFPDSRHLAVQRQSRDQRRLDLLKIDVRTGGGTVLLTETSRAWVDLHDDLEFLERSSQFIWASSRSGYKHLYLYDNNGRLVRPLTAGNWMVVGDGTDDRALLGVDEARAQVYFLANERTPLERHLYVTALDTRTPGVVRRLTQESGWHSVRVSPDLRFFLDTFSDPDRPPRVELRRMNGTPLATPVENALDSKHPYFPYLDEHVRTEFSTLEAADGQVLHYQVMKPPRFDASRRYPLIVDVYGGPGAQRVRRQWNGGARANEGFFRQLLARSGYVVLTLDNRGSAYRGVDFETALHLRLGQVEVADQVAGVRHLAKQPWIDPGRVGVFGWSYGGYMSLMALLTAPDVFQAGFSGAPVSDWRLYDTHYTERYLGTPRENAAGYEASSVLPYVRELRAPLLIMHGMADDNVLFTNSTKLFKRLQDLGKPFDVMAYPGSKHGLLRHAGTGPHAYAMIKKFLDDSLQARPAATSPGAR